MLPIAGKLRVFDFTPDFCEAVYFLGGACVAEPFFTNCESRHRSTDRAAAPGGAQPAAVRRGSALQRARHLFQFALFLLVGVMLFAYYRVPSSNFGRPDRIYPTFIVSTHAARHFRLY